jgi:Sir2- and TIR-associating SLOG family/SIR2-like domain
MARLDWQPTPEQQIFIENYSKYIEAGKAALFAGAGLSRSAGFVDWRGLLKGIARELGLDIDQEKDLVAVAQYFLNTKRNRNRLNEAIIEEFDKSANLTPNHYLLARLPIRSIWTTNYDRLIESAFEYAGRGVDVKISENDFAIWHRGDAILYKMHGDVKQPNLAILTKDDYEKYEKSHPIFLEHLKMDLVTKHFLFVGFSFTDPNLEQIFSRVRVFLTENGPQHFAIMRNPRSRNKAESRRMALWIEDLKRFNIETILVAEYSEIEKLLEAISRFVHRSTVFVSGSSREFSCDAIDGHTPFLELARTIGSALITGGYNLVSGFGVGLGEQVVLGAFRAMYSINVDRERVVIRPFPTALTEPAEQQKLNTQTRHDLIARAGSVIFIGGSQLDEQGNLQASRGVLEEFEIAKRLKRFLIPVGATGHAAAKIWKEVSDNFDKFYPNGDKELRKQFDLLSNPALCLADLTAAILSLVRMAAASQ